MPASLSVNHARLARVAEVPKPCLFAGAQSALSPGAPGARSRAPALVVHKSAMVRAATKAPTIELTIQLLAGSKQTAFAGVGIPYGPVRGDSRGGVHSTRIRLRAQVTGRTGCN